MRTSCGLSSFLPSATSISAGRVSAGGMAALRRVLRTSVHLGPVSGPRSFSAAKGHPDLGQRLPSSCMGPFPPYPSVTQARPNLRSVSPKDLLCCQQAVCPPRTLMLISGPSDSELTRSSPTQRNFFLPPAIILRRDWPKEPRVCSFLDGPHQVI